MWSREPGGGPARGRRGPALAGSLRPVPGGGSAQGVVGRRPGPEIFGGVSLGARTTVATQWRRRASQPAGPAQSARHRSRVGAVDGPSRRTRTGDRMTAHRMNIVVMMLTAAAVLAWPSPY